MGAIASSQNAFKGISPEFRPSRLRFLWLTLALFLIMGCQRGNRNDIDFEAVGLTGVHDMGRSFSISDFYVDGYGGSNVGWEGGGGSNVCCVMLPKAWRPGLTIDLRWAVADWSNENSEETKRGIYTSITFKKFRAQVPVEKYQTPERLFVHFFAGGKARAMTGGVFSERLRDDPAAVALSTEGKPIDVLFSQAELDKMEHKRQAWIKKFGDWR